MGKRKHWHLITHRWCLKCMSFFLHELFLKSPLNIFWLIFPLCPCSSVLPLRRQSQNENYIDEIFLCFTPPPWLTIKTYQSSAWWVSREMTLSIYFQLWATMHAWAVLRRRVLESTPPPLPSPYSAGAGCNNYSHLMCIHPKPCSTKGEKLQQLAIRLGRS